MTDFPEDFAMEAVRKELGIKSVRDEEELEELKAMLHLKTLTIPLGIKVCDAIEAFRQRHPDKFDAIMKHELKKTYRDV